MYKFTCEGFKPVIAETAKEAAQIFAERLARRQHRSSPYATVAINTWGGSTATFQANVGYYDKKTRTAVVSQEWLTITKAETIA